VLKEIQVIQEPKVLQVALVVEEQQVDKEPKVRKDQ